jgi:Asp-tRNA(Asn)/Glu-tRNA(Gln) amidotransferase C subunit
MFKRQEDEVENALDEQIMRSFRVTDRTDIKDEVEEKLDEQIMQLFGLMENLTAYDDEYDKMASAAAKLYQLRKNKPEDYSKAVAASAKLMEMRKKDTISLETWVTVGTHLAGMFMILNHERAHVIATKTFGLLKKII